MRDPKPEPPQFVGVHHERYNGRDFYGTHASERAELTYLRELCAWQARRLNSYGNWERSINEALNTGDGAYRP